MNTDSSSCDEMGGSNRPAGGVQSGSALHLVHRLTGVEIHHDARREQLRSGCRCGMVAGTVIRARVRRIHVGKRCHMTDIR
jgi:hypothetical protein